MIASVRQWYGARAPRERLLILLMVALALPVLMWLLVIAPLDSAYESALDRHLEAVDRNGRIRSLAQTAETEPQAAAPVSGDLALVVTDSAAQAGLTLDSNTPDGQNAVTVAISQAPPLAVTQWLSGFESRGLAVEDLRITPSGPGTVSVTARLTRGAR